MTSDTLQGYLQTLTNTTLDAQGAANVLAGTTGLDLVGALNHWAGTTGRELGYLRDLLLRPTTLVPTATLLTEGASTTDGSSYATSAVVLTANKLYLLFIGIGDAAAGGADEAPSGVASTGATWVQAAFDQRGTSSQGYAVFRTMVGSTQASSAITATFANAQDAMTWHVVEVGNVATSGTNGSGAIAEVVTGEGTSSGSLSLTGVSAGNATIGGIQFNSSTAANFTGFTGWTAIGATQAVGTPSLGSAVGFSSTGGTTMTITLAGAQSWSGAIIELVHA